MKKVFAICLLILILCGCESNKPISANCSNFSGIIDIIYSDNIYQYKILIGSNNATFTPCGNTVSIDFDVSKNSVSASYLENTTDYGNLLNYSPINIVNEVLNQSNGEIIYSDYNGNYVLHDTSKYGEFSLSILKNGYPKNLKIGSLNLLVEFSYIKEVYDGSQK